MEFEFDDPEEVRLVIIGGGPVGLEAGLYARFLGFDVQLFEQQTYWAEAEGFGGRDGDETWRFGDVSTSLAVAALKAQFPDLQLPQPDQSATTDQLCEYFETLARTDLLSDAVRLGRRVVYVGPGTVESGRDDLHNATLPGADGGATMQHNKSADADQPTNSDATQYPLWVRVAAEDGATDVWNADVVIDASGNQQQDSLATPLGMPWAAGLNAPAALEAVGLGRTPSNRWLQLDADADLATRVSWISHPELPFFVIGAKSYGRAEFTWQDGHDQIRDLFAVLGGRATLNLYQSFEAGR